jgi:hypothetical protein
VRIAPSPQLQPGVQRKLDSDCAFMPSIQLGRQSGLPSVCRRTPEIQRRNELRRTAQLPPLVNELRQMKQQEKSKAFRQFQAAQRFGTWTPRGKMED